MTSARWNFPNGTNGEALTAALAGATVVSLAGGTAVISTAQAIIGTRSVKMNGTASGNLYWAQEGLAATAIAADAYIYVTAYPPGTQNLIWIGTGSAARAAALQMAANGTLRLIVSDGATIYTSAVIPLNTWVRISIYITCSPTVGTARVAWYLGHDTTPQGDSGTLTGRDTTSGADRVRVGLKTTTATGTTGEIYFGSWAYDDAATGLLPPYSASIPLGSATFDHQWAISAAGQTPAVPIPTGAATLDHQWAVTAAGQTPGVGIPTGAATFEHAWTVTAEGETPGTDVPEGSATFDHQWEITATGETPPESIPEGSATFDHRWEVTARGVRPPTPAPPVLEDHDVLPIMESILACLCTALDQSPAGMPCFCGIVPGDNITMDYCDCGSEDRGCGQAWVRLDMSIVGSNVYNSVYARSALNTARCVAMMSHRIQIGVTRCLAGMDAQGNPPNEYQNAEAVRIQMGDFAAMRRALDCCFPYDRRREWLFERYTPVGPAGNCVGGYCTFTIRTMS